MKNEILAMAMLTLFALVTLSGCGGVKEAETVEDKFDGSRYVLSAEPDGGQDVAAAFKDVKDGDDIVIIGRVGGSFDPWVKNRAAFNIVDCSLRACSDETPDGETCSCTTPWDYCCETDKLKGAMAMVKFVDADGKVVKHSAQDVFAVKELQTVVIQGKAERDAGNLNILATGMYVRK
jgi:hypothetical protein